MYLFRHIIPKLVEVYIFIPSKDKTTIELEQVINQAGKVKNKTDWIFLRLDSAEHIIPCFSPVAIPGTAMTAVGVIPYLDNFCDFEAG